MNKALGILFVSIVILPITHEAHAQGAEFSSLKTEFTGKGKCLDIVNDGKNDQLSMETCADVTGQMWR